MTVLLSHALTVNHARNVMSSPIGFAIVTSMMIKRVLTIITLERWTVRWDITPIVQLHVQKITSVQVSETVQLLPEDFKSRVEGNAECSHETYTYIISQY
jgi:hypothetical protein